MQHVEGNQGFSLVTAHELAEARRFKAFLDCAAGELRDWKEGEPRAVHISSIERGQSILIDLLRDKLERIEEVAAIAISKINEHYNNVPDTAAEITALCALTEIVGLAGKR
jgi:hypothetical protein